VRPGKRQLGGIAFLLSQLGQRATEQFAARIADLDLTPPQAGILRAIAVAPGRSQQALSDELGLAPSRVVAFVDDLEKRSLVERRRNTDDRRLYALHLTEHGGEVMHELAALATAHEAEFTASLTIAQRADLSALLGRLAVGQELGPGAGAL
jgi:DNA-binding MarR family transcriptional regulator